MDEKLPEWLEQCLTEDDRQLIGIVGTEAFLRLIDLRRRERVHPEKRPL